MRTLNYLIIISVLVAIFDSVVAPLPFHGKSEFNFIASATLESSEVNYKNDKILIFSFPSSEKKFGKHKHGGGGLFGDDDRGWGGGGGGGGQFYGPSFYIQPQPVFIPIPIVAVQPHPFFFFGRK